MSKFVYDAMNDSMFVSTRTNALTSIQRFQENFNNRFSVIHYRSFEKEKGRSCPARRVLIDDTSKAMCFEYEMNEQFLSFVELYQCSFRNVLYQQLGIDRVIVFKTTLKN